MSPLPTLFRFRLFLADRLTPTWIPPTQPPPPRSADLFMILFLSAFLFLTAAVLRLFPWIAPLPPHPRWTPRDALNYPSETDPITRYHRSSFRYGSNDVARDLPGRNPTYETLIAIGDSIGRAEMGMTDEQIAILPKYTLAEVEDPNDKSRRGTTCAICRDWWRVGHVLIVLPCSDEFHSECIAPWLKLQSTCPLCRCRFA